MMDDIVLAWDYYVPLPVDYSVKPEDQTLTLPERVAHLVIRMHKEYMIDGWSLTGMLRLPDNSLIACTDTWLASDDRFVRLSERVEHVLDELIEFTGMNL